jgi:hypothetical protein
MAKPPPSTPHSDIDGVHQDERPNTETAGESGQTPANLGLARSEGKGYPNYVDKDGKKTG